jgi:hypothetical protein
MEERTFSVDDRVTVEMLQGPYRTLRRRLRHVGVSGWLWVAAAILAAIVIALEFA